VAGTTRWRVVAALAASAVLALAGGCGGDDDEEPGGAAKGGSADTGETITMWTRAATQTQSQRLVKAYNASHDNKVELTVIPTDNYQARVAAAAGGKNLPDVFASDVIYAPNYTSQGLYLDITDRIDALDFKDSLAPAHMRLGTYEDRMYTVPHTLDLSVLFYNKDLSRRPAWIPRSRRRRWPSSPTMPARSARRWAARRTARSSAATAPAASSLRSGRPCGPPAATS
jgi:multiple sugar transport system substrate-binding protein